MEAIAERVANLCLEDHLDLFPSNPIDPIGEIERIAAIKFPPHTRYRYVAAYWIKNRIVTYCPSLFSLRCVPKSAAMIREFADERWVRRNIVEWINEQRDPGPLEFTTLCSIADFLLHEKNAGSNSYRARVALRLCTTATGDDPYTEPGLTKTPEVPGSIFTVNSEYSYEDYPDPLLEVDKKFIGEMQSVFELLKQGLIWNKSVSPEDSGPYLQELEELLNKAVTLRDSQIAEAFVTMQQVVRTIVVLLNKYKRINLYNHILHWYETTRHAVEVSLQEIALFPLAVKYGDNGEWLG